MSDLNISWTQLKVEASSRSIPLQWIETDNSYFIYVIINTLIISTQIFKTIPAEVDQLDFEVNYKNNPTPPTPLNQVTPVEVVVNTTAAPLEVTVNATALERNNKYIFDTSEERITVNKNNNYVINFTGYCNKLVISIDEDNDEDGDLISAVASIQINNQGPKIRLSNLSDNSFEFNYKLLSPTFTIFAGSKKSLKFYYFVDGESV